MPSSTNVVVLLVRLQMKDQDETTWKPAEKTHHKIDILQMSLDLVP